MKNLILFSLLILTGSKVLANDRDSLPTIVCSIHSSYLTVKSSIEINLADEIVSEGRADEGMVRFAWSQSECEDSTEIQFDAKQFKDFLSGKRATVSGDLSHEEPDLTIKSNVRCKLK